MKTISGRLLWQTACLGFLLLSAFQGHTQSGVLGQMMRNAQGGSLNTTLESGAGLNGQYNISFPAQSGTVLLSSNGVVNLRPSGRATELRFFNTAGTFYTGLQAGAATANTTFTLPAADGAAGQLLGTNGSGQLQWVSLPTTNTWNLTGNNGTATTSNFLGTTDNSGLAFRTNNTQRMVIDPSGNVGIGIAAPANPLSVLNTIEINRSPSAVSSLLFTNTSGTGDFRIGADGGDVFWQGGGGRNLQMGSYWGIVLSGDRQTAAFPAYSAGVTGVNVTIPSARSTSIPLVVSGATSQSANLTEWRNSTNQAVGAISASGNMGLGTAAPTERLEVSGNLRFSGALMPGGQAGTSGQVLQSNGPGTVPTWVNVSAGSNVWSTSGNSNTSTAILGTLDNNPLRFVVGSSATAERMRITSAGNVGIATTTPVAQASLHIAASASVPNTRMLLDRGGNFGGFTTTASDFIVGTNATAIRFRSGVSTGGDWGSEGTERMVITNGGLVGIGTGSTSLTSIFSVAGLGSNNNNAGVVRVANNAAQPWSSITFPDAINSTDNTLFFGIGRGYSATDRNMSFQIPDYSRYNNTGSRPNFIWTSIGSNNSNIISLATLESGTGNLLLRGSVINSSDSRLKTNVRSLNSNALGWIRQLNGVAYNWNETASKVHGRDTTELQYGVLAQEVEKVLPELVTTDSKGYKTVNYTGLIPVLLEGIKAQQAQIDALKQEINELKKRNP